MAKVLVFGNPLVEEDSLPLRILPTLRKLLPEVEFKEFDAAENLEDEGDDLAILDAAEGIEKVELLQDLERIAEGKRFTMHDFDLAQNLKLLAKLGKLKRVRVFAVPKKYDERKAVEELVLLLKKELGAKEMN